MDINIKTNMQLISSLEALAKIEEIVSDDFSCDMEWKLAFGELKTENERAMAEMIGRVYMLAHAWNPEHSCFSVHDGWRKGDFGEEKDVIMEG